MTLSPELVDALTRFAAHREVLVATDFDGALAPLVLDPMSARPVDGAMETLTALADLPGTTVALVSGRALEPLRELTGAEEPIVLVGSHGAEDSRRPDGLVLTDEQRALLDRLEGALDRLAEQYPGVRVERKPAARVVHTRGLSRPLGEEALEAAEALGERHTSLVVTPGKEVVELAVAHVGKGAALVSLARELDADAVLYAGDDVTDEDAFAAIEDDPDEDRRPRHVSVRVGDGETRARHRVADEHELVEVFRVLLEARSASA
ncbi:hypothetical protein GCM10009584_02610 [Ornithinimicrobium humiphilum]|uniref:trehalose-phosphatase n=1 Tax=Ornithinimicrobium humiphilum TaxID=125288 RepID=UPI0031D03B23